MAAGSSNDFDLIVLGAGTGGYTAAFRAAQLGMNVALVDVGKIGGTCLHVGCIPTKALLESAELFARLKKAKEFGILLEGQPGFDFETIARRRDQVVKRMWTGLKGLVDKNKVTWVAGRGRLEGAGAIRMALNGEDGAPGAGGERVLHARNVILATGSRVKRPARHRARRPPNHHLGRRNDQGRPAEEHRYRRRRRGRLRVRLSVPRPGRQRSRCSNTCRRSSRSRTVTSVPPLERSFTRRGIKIVTKARSTRPR